MDRATIMAMTSVEQVIAAVEPLSTWEVLQMAPMLKIVPNEATCDHNGRIWGRAWRDSVVNDLVSDFIAQTGIQPAGGAAVQDEVQAATAPAEDDESEEVHVEDNE